MHARLYESVLKGDAPEAVSAAREALDAGTGPLEPIDDTSRLIVSCGGGMPPGVPSSNIHALIAAVSALSGSPA